MVYSLFTTKFAGGSFGYELCLNGREKMHFGESLVAISVVE